MNKSETLGFKIALVLFVGYLGWPYDEVVSKLSSFSLLPSTSISEMSQKSAASVKVLPNTAVVATQDAYRLASESDSFMLTKVNGLPLPPLNPGQKLVLLCSSGEQLAAMADSKSPHFFVDRGVGYEVGSEPPKAALVKLKNLKFRRVSELWVQGQGFGFSKQTSHYVSTGIGCSQTTVSKRPEILAESSTKSATTYASISSLNTVPSTLIKIKLRDGSLLPQKDKLNAVLGYGLGLLSLEVTTEPSLDVLKKVSTFAKYLDGLPSVIQGEESLASTLSAVERYNNAVKEQAKNAEQERKVREAVPAYKLHEATDLQVAKSTQVVKSAPVSGAPAKAVSASLPVGQAIPTQEVVKQKTVPSEKVVIKYVPNPAMEAQLSKLSTSVLEMQRKMEILEEENAQLRKKQAKLSEVSSLEPFKTANPSVLLSKPVSIVAPTKKEISVNENISAN